MKNITVSVPDDVYQAARVAAAERRTSVSALVAEHLGDLAGTTSDSKARARQQLIDAIERARASSPGFSAGNRLPRDEIYARGLH